MARDGRHLLHGDAGSPYLFYAVPTGAEPVSLTWSPAGWAFAVVERRGEGLVAQILRSFKDYNGTQFSLPLEHEHIAISDDGVTTFTVSGATVKAQNQLTGTEVQWHVEGGIIGIRLVRTHLLIALTDRVLVVPYHE